MLKLLLTCEHGGNDIPADYAAFFENEQELLQSHRGYDPGALELFHVLEDLADKAFYATTSRLLVELNRSLHHKKLFSPLTADLPEEEKKKILKQYYFPYRRRVEELIYDLAMVGHQVLHIAVHSFTPVLDGIERQADIGLLYDPKRKGEQNFCRTWKKSLTGNGEEVLVRFNYPYLGTADGFPTYLRRKFTDEQYLGIELEVNQKLLTGAEEPKVQLHQLLKQSLHNVLTYYRQD